MASKETRQLNRRIIENTLAYVSPGSDPRCLLPTALRESGFSHRVDAKHPADVNGAKKAFERTRKTIYRHNTWIHQPDLWHTSRGLFQFMVPNHLHRYDANADPRVLWHPVVATIVAARLFNRLVDYGASNMCEIRSGWAGGPGYWKRDPNFEKRCASLRNRLRKMGFPESLAEKPVREFGLEPFGMSPQKWDKAVVVHVSNMEGIPDDSMPQFMPKEWPAAFLPLPDWPQQKKKGSGALLIGSLVALGLVMKAKRDAER